VSSGKVHDKATFFLLFPFLIATFFYFKAINFAFILCALGYLAGGLLFGPDLDCKSRQYRRWGLLRFIWIPYQKLGGHRSFVSQSHDSIFGLIFRLIYFSVVCLFFIFVSCYLINRDFSQVLDILQSPKTLSCLKTGWPFLAGLWVGNLSHLLMDWIDGVIKLPKKF
jgi:uncharacterized metal-binding protein